MTEPSQFLTSAFSAAPTWWIVEMASDQNGSPSNSFGAATLPKTNIAPENGWLEDEISYWEGLFSGDLLVSQRVS